MNFTFAAGDPTRIKADVLVLPLFDSELSNRRQPHPVLAAADRKLKGLLLEAAAQEGFKAKPEQTLVFHTHGKLAVDRLILVGLGAPAQFEAEVLRLAAGRAVKTANRLRAKLATVCIPDSTDPELAVRAVVEGFELGGYRFDRYRTTNKEEKAAPRIGRVQLSLPAGQERNKPLDRAVTLGKRIADATNWARDLVNEPAGVMTPTRLAEEARRAAEAAGLTIDVKGLDGIRELKMGMFLGVTQGSLEQPQLIQLSYVPKNAEHAQRAPLALVGKAITFDSGGLSLKTAEGMVDMKTDMAGSAAVLGAMQVIAALAPPFPVHAFMGACENMPSGNAYRPGDVLISRLGKTVEITNTDAEGRLVLGDMLTWANETKPSAIIDLATLTGACIVALGHYVVGAFAEQDEIIEEVLAAANAAGEALWRLPISPFQKDALRSDIADMKNSGERWGAAINAAVFLKEFVGNTPWVHLDIAGPSQSPKDRGYQLKGATGVGVRTLVELVRRRTAVLEQEETAAPVQPDASKESTSAAMPRAESVKRGTVGRKAPASVAGATVVATPARGRSPSAPVGKPRGSGTAAPASKTAPRGRARAE